MSPRSTTSTGSRDPCRIALAERDILYLHDNYVVTDGIFKDENVVFDEVNEDWKAFCTKDLEFKIPAYETAAKE